MKKKNWKMELRCVIFVSLSVSASIEHAQQACESLFMNMERLLFVFGCICFDMAEECKPRED